MSRERLALRVMQLGAIAVVLAVSTRHAFELDRFFVPKELVLHVTALLAAALIVRRVDLLLGIYLLIGVISAALATNRWLGLRALAISASGILLMMAARRLAEMGLGRPLLGALGTAVVLVAITSLLQTYGIDVDLFSENRAPGGTLGNRNFVAHAAAFGLPLVLLCALTAQSAAAYLRWAVGATLVVASLVLTRSRAAWLAFGVVMLVIIVSMVIAPQLRARWRRLGGIVLIAGAGVAAALVIPNTLRWRSDNPYLESVQRVADYQQGSGRGRLVQYTQSLKMAVRHALFGVGPGNWAVTYPAHAARHDPSLSDTDGGMTTNPWPSSDWIAFIAERGPAAAVLLAIVFVMIALAAFRQLRAGESPEEAAALLAMLTGVTITGALDAVLLLGLPTLLVWTAIGALWRAGVPPAPRGTSRVAVLLAITITALGAIRSAAQLTAMEIYATTGDRASLERAARIDPANYRLQLRLARMGGRQRCDHARAAHALFPSADEAASLNRRCR